ncbi:MAG: hypothetical protein J6R04_01930 [Clostridia bacterium]|nr:hypothetical protein [Clostridia bacterium]
MRYFKYKHPKTTERRVLREQYATLDDEKKKLVRKDRLLRALSRTLFIVSSVSCGIGLNWLISRIPEPKMLPLTLLAMLGELVLRILSIVVAIAIGALLSIPIAKRVNDSERTVEREVLSRACEHLRAYYGLCEPCLVTKCFDSSNPIFPKHDVCLFFVEGELRLTANLTYGFFHGDKDPGCYAMHANEITLSQVQYGHHTATQLEADGVTFLLGQRALPFIRKHILTTDAPN